MTNSEYQQLAEFLGRRFDTIDRRFDAIDQRLDGHDRQFTAVAQRFDTIDRRFDVMQERLDEKFLEVFGHFDEVYRRLEGLEQEYHAITQALRRIEGLLADEAGRREVLERSVQELKHQAAVLQARIEELEQQIRR